MQLRILHNGSVLQKEHVGQMSPHWHLKIWRDGCIRGEIIGRQTDFKAIQRIERQLDETDTTTLFTEAESMRSRFVSRQLQSEDVMVESSNHDGIQFLFAVPQEQQADATVLPFFRILNQLLEPYA
jgi:hypothetical protein